MLPKGALIRKGKLVVIRQSDGAAAVAEPVEHSALIHELMQAARGSAQNRRAGGREPFFHPGMVVDPYGRETAVFTRDVSQLGIGLLHAFPLLEGPSTLHLQLPERPRIVLPLRIEWCLPCGEGFFISGASFASGV